MAVGDEEVGSGSGGTGTGSKGDCSEEGLGYEGCAARELAAALADFMAVAART
jgi:hypothetical protein